MLIPEDAIPLDWWDRMERVLIRGRRKLKDKENLCSACGEPLWEFSNDTAEMDEVIREISLTNPVLVKWTDGNPASPYGIGDLLVYQFCDQCRS